MGRKVVKSTAADPEELDSSIRRRRQQQQQQQERQQQASCEKPCVSPRGLLRGRKSLTKSSSTTTESPRRWSVFSSNSVSNNSNNNNNTVAISPRSSLQVSRHLDFSSPKSVTSKGAGGGGCAAQTQATTIMSPKKAASGLNGVVVFSPRESVVSSVGNSQRFSENGDAESMTSNYCTGGGGGAAAICIDELRQLESILHASGARLDELYRKVWKMLSSASSILLQISPLRKCILFAFLDFFNNPSERERERDLRQTLFAFVNFFNDPLG
jgi:hypothetical protein